MKKITTQLVASLILIAAGCATVPSITEWDSATVASKSSVRRDDFKKISSVSSPLIYFGKMNDIVVHSTYKLVAERKDGEQPRYFVVVDTQRGYGMSWAFWREAYDKDGTKFPLSQEAQEVVTGGVVREISSALVGREYFDGIKQSGTSWKIYGGRAEDAFPITPNLVQGFLTKCDEQFKPQ